MRKTRYMRKIKVLHTPPPYAKAGGVSKYILTNMKYLDKSRYHFDFLSFSKIRLEIEDELNRQGCKMHYISCYPQENETRFISELNAVFDEGYDAIHLHTSYWKGYQLEEVAIRRNIPVVIVHSHSTMVGIRSDNDRLRALEVHEKVKSEFHTGLATHFCACSKDAADWLYGEQIPRDRVMILKNAIDTDTFSYKLDVRDRYRNELEVNGTFVIGYVGRLCYQKNPDMLIDIFNNVSKRVPNTKLLLAGIGEQEESIRERVNNYGLSGKVLFLGYRTDIPELLQAMDLFVLPSRFEGFGISQIEAQCAGLPCFASEFIPVEAKLTSNFEFLPYNAGVWADRIVEIAAKSDIRKDMSEEITKAGFSVREQIRVLEKIYSNEI